MEHEDHRQTARDFLIASDREFLDGDKLQASEKLWGAATHAVMAAAVQRNWPCRTHRELKLAVDRLADEFQDELLPGGFVAAEKFHKNFYHDEMEDYEITSDRPQVHRFVHHLLALIEPSSRNGGG